MNLTEIDAALAGLEAYQDACSSTLHVGPLSSDCVDCGVCHKCIDRDQTTIDLLKEKIALLETGREAL